MKMRIKVGYFKNVMSHKMLIFANLENRGTNISTGYPADTVEQFVNSNMSYMALFTVLSNCMKT